MEKAAKAWVVPLGERQDDVSAFVTKKKHKMAAK